MASFVEYCNNNNNSLDLSFTYVTDPSQLVFLDLKLFHDECQIRMRNHLKCSST